MDLLKRLTFRNSHNETEKVWKEWFLKDAWTGSSNIVRSWQTITWSQDEMNTSHKSGRGGHYWKHDDLERYEHLSRLGTWLRRLIRICIFLLMSDSQASNLLVWYRLFDACLHLSRPKGWGNSPSRKYYLINERPSNGYTCADGKDINKRTQLWSTHNNSFLRFKRTFSFI